MRLFAPEDALRAAFLMESFDRAEIERYLGYLRRDNVLVEISGPDVATTDVERYFEVPYRIGPPLQPKRSPELAVDLPQENAYLPGNPDFAPYPLDELPPASTP